MVAIKEGFTQAQSQLFAIGAAILAEAKAKKTRAEVQKQNDDLFAEYVKTKKCKTLTELSAAIMADGQADPKWKKGPDGSHIGYQKAILAGSVGAAGYNSFRSWCAKWHTEQLVRLTPEDIKAGKNKKAPAAAPEQGAADGHEGADPGLKVAAEAADPLVAKTTAELIAELKKRADAGDAEAIKLFG